MTLQALRLPKKVEPCSDNREQEHPMAVYGETGEVAMNDRRIEIFSIPLFAASGRVSTAIV
ncbi:hypothetical protein ACFYE9_02060 [Rhizobium leguminosarum]|uniref:Uncharacterized protein n=2 Tax=Rhizobium leguminosarum TaxID=384 RepID=A0A154I9Z2_RHILE|nr:hypothetical protein [Rhizobium leguminosarum]KZA96927.1 hypothetical protein A4A59_33885 [Rhizobium leguminosarum]